MSQAKVVLITGCSSGFGRFMAETLARKSYQVFATMRAVQGRNSNAAHELGALAERESLPQVCGSQHCRSVGQAAVREAFHK